ncbi:MAG: response regulator [bacterium]|jgi:two-component system phosphate regulon response regulator PhoB
MAKKQILVVDDEEDILELVRYNLVKEGYAVQCLKSAESALSYARANHPDLILLDIMLPGMNGLDACRALKSDPSTAKIPVIMLSAKGEEADIVAGLELGAEDYITKPFSPRVLVARLRAAFRRRLMEAEGADKVIKIHGLVIHPGRREVAAGDRKFDLTFSEFGILHFLASRPGWVFTRYQITDAVRGDEYAVTDRSVDVHIAGLRKKLGEYGNLIETVRGVGYRFKE